MPSIQEISDAVAQVSSLTEDLCARTKASSGTLKDRAQKLAYLGQGSRSGEIAAQAANEAAASLEAALASMEGLSHACNSYRKAIEQ